MSDGEGAKRSEGQGLGGKGQRGGRATVSMPPQLGRASVALPATLVQGISFAEGTGCSKTYRDKNTVEEIYHR